MSLFADYREERKKINIDSLKMAARKAIKKGITGVYIYKADGQLQIKLGGPFNTDKDMVIGFTPGEILRDNHCVYNGWETSIDKALTVINAEKPGT